MSISHNVKAPEKGSSSVEHGFTLIELMVALAVLAVVLATLAPAYYGAMRAAAAADQRAIANGLAVAASEQLRSIPYWEIGYTSADYQSSPQGVGYPCIAASSNSTVQVSSTPMDNASLMPTSATQAGVAYSIQRCVYWVNSSVSNQTQFSGLDGQAYKQSVVTVSWTVHTVSGHVTQTSEIYPGGQGAYKGAQDNHTPTTNAATTGTTPPSAPVWTNGEYQKDPANGSTEIDLVWTEPTSPTPAVRWEVDYTTSQNYGGSGQLSQTPGTFSQEFFNTPGTTANPNTIPVGAGQSYYIEVWAYAADGTKSTSPSSVVGPVATQASSASCNMTVLKVTPGTATIGSNDKFSGSTTTFSISITNAGNGTCSNVTVSYTTKGATPASAIVSGSGTLTGTAGDTTTKWDTGNDTFTVYQNGAQYVPSGGGLLQQQVDITCTGNC